MQELKLTKGKIALVDKEEDASRAYDTGAIIHFGEFANLNFKN